MFKKKLWYLWFKSLYSNLGFVRDPSSLPRASQVGRESTAMADICVPSSRFPKCWMGEECARASKAGKAPTRDLRCLMWTHISLGMPLTKSNSPRALCSTLLKTSSIKSEVWVCLCVRELECYGGLAFKVTSIKRIHFHRVMTQAWLGSGRWKRLILPCRRAQTHSLCGGSGSVSKTQ